MWWGRPKPLYHSTASQLGLHKTKGIPNLLDFVLPRNAPQVSTLSVFSKVMNLSIRLGACSNLRAVLHTSGLSSMSLSVCVPLK
jgi:hypothetical protein